MKIFLLFRKINKNFKFCITLILSLTFFLSFNFKCITNSNIPLALGFENDLLANLIATECSEDINNYNIYSDSNTNDIKDINGDLIVSETNTSNSKIFICGIGTKDKPYRILHDSSFLFLSGTLINKKLGPANDPSKQISYTKFIDGSACGNESDNNNNNNNNKNQCYFKILRISPLDLSKLKQPIANGTTFNGGFNGAGVSLINLTTPLFNTVSSVSILENIALSDVNINKPNESFLGSIAKINFGTINNCTLTNININGADYIGSLAGQNSGNISNSTTTTTLNGADNIGGLVGYNTGSISNSNASSNITTSGYNWGPLVGSLISNILLKENGGKLEVYINNNNWNTSYEYKNEIILNESYLNETNLSNGNGMLSSSYGETRVKSNFKIYFDTDGETSSTISNLPSGINYNIPSYNKYGYTFVSWKSGETIYNTNSNFIIPNSYVTFTVIWQKNADANGNGLLEIYTINDLNNVRYNLGGTSWKTSETETNWNTLGCPYSRCKGYELANNINFSGSKWASNCTGADCVTSGWEPIGTQELPFSATFNGNGFEIRNLYFKLNKDNVGLFGYVSGPTAIIKSLGLENVYIENNNDNTGSLVGYLDNGGTIIQSHASGKVIGIDNIGGLVGKSFKGTINSCYVSGIINGNLYVGGLVGHSTDNTINLSWVTGVIYGTRIVGGLVGFFNTGKIENSYTNIEINGNDSVGGLVGLTNNNSILASNYVVGNVRGINEVGGLVGTHTQATIVSSNVTGKVSGEKEIGGLVGTSKNGTIHYSNANTMISVEIKENNSSVGGLVGNFGIGIIKDSYTTGWISVIASQNNDYRVGGLIGTIKGGEFKNSFSKSNIIITGNNGEIGGFVGHVENTMTTQSIISNCISSGSINVTLQIATSACSFNIGGIVGNHAQGNISNCYTTSNILVTSTSNACSTIGEFFGNNTGMINNSLFDVDTSSFASQKNADDVSKNFFGLTTNQLKENINITSNNRYIGNNFFWFEAGFYPKLCNSSVSTSPCSDNFILPGQ